MEDIKVRICGKWAVAVSKPVSEETWARVQHYFENLKLSIVLSKEGK